MNSDQSKARQGKEKQGKLRQRLKKENLITKHEVN